MIPIEDVVVKVVDQNGQPLNIVKTTYIAARGHIQVTVDIEDIVDDAWQRGINQASQTH